MPTTVGEIFDKHNINNFKQIKWGTPFIDNEEGVYIVSTSSNPVKHLGITDEPLFDDKQIFLWLRKLDNFLIDHKPATVVNLKKRLTEFWFPNESILYIGKAPKRSNGQGISKRVSEYFATEIGEGGPHSGGQWLKVLKNISSFSIYYGYTNNSALVEKNMMKTFMENVSKFSLGNLFDKELPLPFANIKYTGNKKHRLKNQRL